MTASGRSCAAIAPWSWPGVRRATTRSSSALAATLDIDEGATVRHVFFLQSNDPDRLWFTSFEAVKTGHEKDPGRILTFASTDRPSPSASFSAVEEEARRFATVADAAEGVDATNEGVVVSRGCVADEQPL